MIDLAHPWFLLLLSALPWLAWPRRHSLADLTVRQHLVCLGVRTLILLALIMALAGVRFRLPAQALSVVYLVDDSASMSAEANHAARAFIAASAPFMRPGDHAGVVGFAGDAVVWQAPATRLKLQDRWPDLALRKATDLGRALTFASAIFTPDSAKRLVLLSDGQDTGDRDREAAQTLGRNGIEVFTVPLHNPFKPEAFVEKIDAPQRVKSGEPFDLAARIRSNIATQCAVKLYENQFLIDRREVELRPGENEVLFNSLHPEGNIANYEIEILPAQDTRAENNRAQALVSLRGQPHVLIVDEEERRLQPLAAALRANKIEVETRGAAGLPEHLADLQQFDLFMLSDVPALQISRTQMELYRSWVQDFGGGFLLLGGENSFGVGGYAQTPVAQMLPVRMEHDDREETPTVAMLIVLDRSGSMASVIAGQTKISLADQGAAYALNVLQAKDLFGMLAVDTRIHAVVPLGKVTDKAAAQEQIMSVTAAGGGIYIYSSLVEAYQQLRDTNAKIKHVILFSDASDAEEKSGGEMSDGAAGNGAALDLAAAMLADKISTSVVALGLDSDKDTEFLKQLSERGGGRFYLTSDPLTLPQIFSTETIRVVQSSLVEEAFAAIPTQAHASAFAGIDWAQAPLLLGYNATKLKPTADLWLATERGEPLLATWRYGLGQAAAFTSDAKARWASEWLGWPGYGKFWPQLVRVLMRKTSQTNFQISTSESGEQLTLDIDVVTPDGKFRDGLPLTVQGLAPAGTTISVTAAQEAPGKYHATFPLPVQGTSVFSINAGQDGDTDVFSYARSFPKEFLTSETNLPLLHQLAEIGHGKFAPEPADVFARPAQAQARWLDLTPWFLSAALVLFPLDIWLRRRTWER